MTTVEDPVDAALRRLRGSGLVPPGGAAGARDVREIWHSTLAQFDAGCIAEAAYKWSQNGTSWPKLSEFVAACNTALANRAPTTECDRCHDGWLEDTDGSNYPCGHCRPALYARWRGGHLRAYTGRTKGPDHPDKEPEALFAPTVGSIGFRALHPNVQPAFGERF